MSLPTLPASALYSHPSLGRLWKSVHLACSPFIRRSAVRRLYTHPATLLNHLLQKNPYALLALGCADGLKEFLLLKKLPRPHQLIAADTNLSLARIAAKRLSAITKSARQVDLTSNSSIAHLLTHTSVPDLRSPHSPSSNPKSITHNPQSPATRYRTLVTLFGVLPNLPPQPLLRRVSRLLEAGDLLLFSGNLAPGINGRKGALRVLSQYDNPPTRRWLLSALALYQPKLPAGKLSFGVFPDPSQSSLFRIEARWITPRRSWILFSSRRPTSRQVESWIHSAKLQRLHRWLDPRGEEGVWLVRR